MAAPWPDAPGRNVQQELMLTTGNSSGIPDNPATPLAETSPVSGAVIQAAALPQLLRNAGRPVRIHVYGNSMDQEDRFWRTVVACSEGALIIVQNSALAGYTSAQVLAAMQTAGFNSSADIVVFGEGTNDALNSVTDATSMANIAACIALIRAAGKMPLLRLPPPNDNAWNSRVLTNWRSQLILAEQLGVYAWDAFAKYVDTDGSYVAGFSTDNTHPTASNYSIAAAEAWAMLSSLSRPYWLPRSNAGQGLVGSNVLQLTDGATPNLGSGWDTLSSLVAPVHTKSSYSYPFRGTKNSVEISQSTNASIYKQINSGFSVGDRVRLTGIYGLDGTISNINAVVYLTCVGPSLITYAVYTSAAMSDQYVSCEVVIPATTTALQIWVRALPTAAGTQTGRLNFGCMDVYNITTGTYVTA